MNHLLLLLFLLIQTNTLFAAPDLARERRMADEIVDSILDGEPVYLTVDGHDFLNIYTQSMQQPTRRAIIILHGRGFHPNWEQVVLPLRAGLAEAGMNTLSMQMPVLDKNAKYYDYVPNLPYAFPRIEAGINYLKQRGNDEIILIAHSCSVHMVMAWVDAGNASDINAFIGIGMGATDYQQPMAKPFPLDKLDVPLLDIYGSSDYPAVLRKIPERKRAIMKAGNKKSKQISVADADHYFTDRGEVLLSHILKWLDTI